MNYKVGDGKWINAKNADIRFLGYDYKIGFAAWGVGGHDVTFSEFKVGRSSETTYEKLMNEESVALCRGNTAPVISSVTFDADRYQVGDTAAVTYTYSDADGDEAGQPYNLWSYAGGCAVTREPSFTVIAEGGLTCAVFPVDALGAHGAPAEGYVDTVSGEADLAAVELAVEALMPGVGTTAVNGVPVENNAVLTLDVTETITIVRSAEGIGDVQIAYNNYRTPVPMTRTETGYQADLEFINGLNSFYITVVAKDGINNGLTETTFGPNTTCNRAQVVTFLYRAYNK